ncbi:hypothetical protein [Actinoplanes sp. L3-i22]|uniref:hypothetical protein n=1 Tax=Actinoplanes sp. L3-i22 TaxID=2836373 RepID=UPI001C843496|nr:hypothetical protein [Actinoplanes sp. L3-i22]
MTSGRLSHHRGYVRWLLGLLIAPLDVILMRYETRVVPGELTGWVLFANEVRPRR